MNKNSVIILGAGITGLSAACYLEKKGIKDILIIEGSSRAGGKVETIHEDGFLVEKGPDSFVTTKPYALDLIHDLGLDDELISPKTNRFFILDDNKFLCPPKGMNMMVPLDLQSFLESRFFSWPAKHRILEESVIPPLDSEEDESFASFITRRFGKDMLDRYAGPLFTGIYATPADELSLNATFPMLKKMEREWGSITRAIKNQAAKQPAASGNRSGFMGLKNGMQTITDAMISGLKHTSIMLKSIAAKVEINNENEHNTYIVTTESGEQFQTSNLIVTLPASQSAKLIENISPASGKILSSFHTSSSRIVTLAYKKEELDENLLATGYVSALDATNSVSSATWVSSKWEGRAKEGYILIRCFLGKIAETLTMSKDELIRTAHSEISSLLNLDTEPEYYWIQDWDQSLPQYKVGHLDKVRNLADSLKPFSGLQLTGSYLYGVGLPDCVRMGKEVAEELRISNY